MAKDVHPTQKLPYVLTFAAILRSRISYIYLFELYTKCFSLKLLSTCYYVRMRLEIIQFYFSNIKIALFLVLKVP